MIEGVGHRGGRCVVLSQHDAPSLAALSQAILAGGLEIVTVVGRWPDLLAAVVEHDPAAVVVDLALAGRAGVRVVGALQALAPRCRIVVVSEFRALDLATVEAGASAVVDPQDLRPLTAALRRSDGERVQA